MSTVFSAAVDTPSRQTLGEIPQRAFQFLRALGTHPEIRHVVKEHGYTQACHEEGWKLLLAASGSRFDLGDAPRMSTKAGEAIDELATWCPTGFHLTHAALMRKFPDQCAFLFQELAPAQGPESVLAVAKFLDRLDVLDNGTDPDRKETVDADKKAVESLSTRDLSRDERARLRKLVEIVQSEPMIPRAVVKAEAVTEANTADLIALYAWYNEWTEVARTVVTARQDKILLGIAHRRNGASEEADPPAAAPESPAKPS